MGSFKIQSAGYVKLPSITQFQYSRIQTGETNPNKHIKKLLEIFRCKLNKVF